MNTKADQKIPKIFIQVTLDGSDFDLSKFLIAQSESRGPILFPIHN